MRYEDLPPELRRQVDAKLSDSTPRRKPKNRAESRGGSPGQCSCGERFSIFSAYERHRRGTGEPGHARYDLDL